MSAIEFTWTQRVDKRGTIVSAVRALLICSPALAGTIWLLVVSDKIPIIPGIVLLYVGIGVGLILPVVKGKSERSVTLRIDDSGIFRLEEEGVQEYPVNSFRKVEIQPILGDSGEIWIRIKRALWLNEWGLTIPVSDDSPAIVEAVASLCSSHSVPMKVSKKVSLP